MPERKTKKFYINQYKEWFEKGEREKLEAELEKLYNKPEKEMDTYLYNFRMGLVNTYLADLSTAVGYFQMAQELKPGDLDSAEGIEKCMDFMTDPSELVKKSFRERVKNSWKLFGEKEKDLLEMLSAETVNEELRQSLLLKLDNIFKEALPGFIYNVEKKDGKNLLYFTLQMSFVNAFALQYFKKEMPEKFSKNWDIVLKKPAQREKNLELEGEKFSLKDVDVYYQPTGTGVLDIFVDAKKITDDYDDDREWILDEMLSMAIGENPAVCYIDNYIDLNDDVEEIDEGMEKCTLNELYSVMENMGYAMDISVEEVLAMRISSYMMKPDKYNNFMLTNDIYRTQICFKELFENYILAEAPDCIADYLLGQGIVPLMFTFSHMDYKNNKSMHEFMCSFEEFLEKRAGENSFMFIGLHVGFACLYMGILAYDYEAVMKAARAFGKEHSDKNILSKTYYKHGGFDVMAGDDRDIYGVLKDSISSLQVITDDPNSLPDDTLVLERIMAIEDVEEAEVVLPFESIPGNINFVFDENVCDCSIFSRNFEEKNIRCISKEDLSEEEDDRLKSAKGGLMLVMKYADKPLEYYRLHLSMLEAIEPEMVAAYDKNSRKILSRKWIEERVYKEKKLTYEDLYNIHKITDEKGNIWIHTHGLNRFGLTELEILGVTEENCEIMTDLLQKVAAKILDNVYKGVYQTDLFISEAYINAGIAVTVVPWHEALELYEEEKIPGLRGNRVGLRKNYTSIIMVFKNEDDFNEGVITKPAEIADILKNL